MDASADIHDFKRTTTEYWRVALRDVLFHDGDIVELGEKAEDDVDKVGE